MRPLILAKLPACAVLLACVSVAPAAGAGSLAEQLQPLIDGHEGRVAVAVKHLETGEQFMHRAAQPMPTASLIKLAVMVEAYRQAQEEQLDLDQLVTLAEDDKVPGSGILTGNFFAGTRLPLRGAVRLMIAYSDNTATNLVLDAIGLESTSRTMENLGWPNTKIHAKVFRGDTSIFPERSKQFGLGSTTAAETVALLERLHEGELVSAEACGEMLEHLRKCDDGDKLGRFLPPEARLAHKTGSVSAARCDAGILETPGGPIAICVLTSQNADHSWQPDNAGNLLCARIGRAVYDHFNRSSGKPAGPQPLAVGASGPLVSDLQRTLNARLSPSPELSVDGDFGPQTEAAVRRFQRENNLAANGRVDQTMWKALGPLVDKDPPVADPETIHGQLLPLQPPESLDEPPLVTCKAWAIADGETGRLLWGEAEGEALDIASITKLMTAHLVLKLADADPAVLEERVTFSERADQTSGSTAGVRAGERLPVSELLYGLLLPSGNDAAVALAEYFGSRFEANRNEAGSADGAASSGLDGVAGIEAERRFVAEMNREAKRLGMEMTHFQNPHGLTAKGHVSSARDLLRLAHAALQNDRMQAYVATRQRGCRVEGTKGAARNLHWKNTNRLLAIEGYQGIKTGTTTAAGACLLASGQRGGQQLLLVVLGAGSSDARYVDARNLYRWAWKQLEESE